MQVLVGADPEVFVRNAEGEPVPACGLIPGTKAEPHRVDSGAVQVDGLALEFNVDPAITQEQFVDSIEQVQDTLAGMLPPDLFIAEDLNIDFVNHGYEGLSEEDRRIGCDPELRLYNHQTFPYHWLNDLIDVTGHVPPHVRQVGGHVHVGWTQNEDINSVQHVESCKAMVRELDVYLGLPAMLMGGGCRERLASGYGLPGSYRIKPYGVEYRTMSNFWIKDRQLSAWVYESVQQAVQGLINNTELFPSTLECYEAGGELYSLFASVFTSEGYDEAMLVACNHGLLPPDFPLPGKETVLDPRLPIKEEKVKSPVFDDGAFRVVEARPRAVLDDAVWVGVEDELPVEVAGG